MRELARTASIQLPTAFLAFVAFAFLLAVQLPANAQMLLTKLSAPHRVSDQVLSIETYDAWQVICETAANINKCHLSATGKTTEDTKRPITLYLSSMKQSDGKSVLILETPLDLLVSKGVELRFDQSAPLKLGYRSCHASGCVAPFRLDLPMAVKLKKGTLLIARVFGLDAKPIDIEFSLIGFTAASSSLGS